MLTALPWGMQESGAREEQGCVRAGRSDTGKPPSVASDEEGARGHQEGKKEAGGKIRAAKPQEWR